MLLWLRAMGLAVLNSLFVTNGAGVVALTALEVVVSFSGVVRIGVVGVVRYSVSVVVTWCI